MPLFESSYQPPYLFRNGHLQTVFPTLFRRISVPQYSRERIQTPDGDFLDLDWIHNGSSEVALLLHGLEGSSQAHYIRGTAAALSENDWDICALNFRGCSGEPNRKFRSYHSGATEDVHTCISHILSKDYDTVALVGFSLGGNLALKYLGESKYQTADHIGSAVAISVPCDLESSANKISAPQNYPYEKRFLLRLRKKIKAKAKLFPDKIYFRQFRKIRKLREFDDLYTAPAHGYEDSSHYYSEASSRQFLSTIATPTLIINAEDDPILSDECYPREEAENNPNLYLEIPRHGGHVGFISFTGKQYWHERRSVAFLNSSKQNPAKADG
ncbi:MAG: alpha/beta fold hydrolase [Candidatus Marinimicrobia bacterium]|nr:alpha/beta fold hydrolase [Candidatus Neomarinimicrobiota bacterium]MCF7829483.1 alpha/beta fold hydrolase [Candidatus Neomarinimicrobiota bacterium]MCF7880119.1 alpha/beta fold hydrolase [Candidatus Neomarinimicrobiota bacterium]